VVALESLLDVTEPSVTAEGFGYDPGRGELWFVGETAEAVLLELQGRRSALHTEAKELGAQLEEAIRIAGESADRARVAEAAYGKVPRRRAATLDARLHARLVELATGLREGIDGAERAATRFEAPLRARVDAGSTRAGELGEALRTLGASEVSLRQELDEAPSAHGGRGRDRAHRRRGERRDEAPRVAGEVEPAEGDDRDELAARVSGSRRGASRSARSIRSRARSTRPRRSG
jgi:hypothetical protein